jgi:hypothetical protein
VHDIVDLCINKCRLPSIANYLCELINLDVYYLYSRGHFCKTSFLLPRNNGSGLPTQGRGCGSDAQPRLESRHERTQEPGSRDQGWTAAGLLPGMATMPHLAARLGHAMAGWAAGLARAQEAAGLLEHGRRRDTPRRGWASALGGGAGTAGPCPRPRRRGGGASGRRNSDGEDRVQTERAPTDDGAPKRLRKVDEGAHLAITGARDETTTAGDLGNEGGKRRGSVDARIRERGCVRRVPQRRGRDRGVGSVFHARTKSGGVAAAERARRATGRATARDSGCTRSARRWASGCVRGHGGVGQLGVAAAGASDGALGERAH